MFEFVGDVLGIGALSGMVLDLADIHALGQVGHVGRELVLVSVPELKVAWGSDHP
jgi:hypothetical protein